MNQPGPDGTQAWPGRAATPEPPKPDEQPSPAAGEPDIGSAPTVEVRATKRPQSPPVTPSPDIDATMEAAAWHRQQQRQPSPPPAQRPAPPAAGGYREQVAPQSPPQQRYSGAPPQFNAPSPPRSPAPPPPPIAPGGAAQSHATPPPQPAAPPYAAQTPYPPTDYIGSYTPAPYPQQSWTAPPNTATMSPAPAAPKTGSKVQRRTLLLGAAAAVVLLAGMLVVVLVLPAISGGKELNVDAAQTGVQDVLTDKVKGYGAASVTDVTCNDGRNPEVKKGATFTCDVTIDGQQRRVTATFTDDDGAYEVGRPQ